MPSQLRACTASRRVRSHSAGLSSRPVSDHRDGNEERDARTAAEELFGDKFELMNRYVDILISRGVDWGLLGPRESDRIWSRHVVNCAAIAQLAPEGVSMIDVGSGAGLPGLVVAILRPDLRITLLEPLLRRANFLSGVIEELGLLDRVRVIRERAEDHQFCYALVTARAVARLVTLLGWVEPLMSDQGQLLALKGRSADAEIAQARSILTGRRLVADVVTVQPRAELAPATVLRVRRAH